MKTIMHPLTLMTMIHTTSVLCRKILYGLRFGYSVRVTSSKFYH